jgi:hypothetical protein
MNFYEMAIREENKRKRKQLANKPKDDPNQLKINFDYK